VLGVAIADVRLLPLLGALLAAGSLLILFRLPLAGVVVLLLLVASVFPWELVSFELGSLRTPTYEIVLAGLLVVAILKPRRATWGGTAGGALALFFVVLAASEVVALLDERAAPTDIFNWGRPFLMLSLFYVIVRLFPDRRSAQKVLIAGALVGAATGAMALLFAVGSTPPAILEAGGETFVTEDQRFGSLSRVRLPGLGLAYVLFWFVVVGVLYARGWRRLGWLLLLAGAVLAITLSFNRNMWIGLLVGATLMMLFAMPSLRHRLLVGIAGAAAAIALVFAGPGGTDEDRSALAPLAERTVTLLDPASLRGEDSLRSRNRETREALGVAAANPVLGVGPGVSFGVFFYEAVGSDYVRTPQLFLHNQYLYLVVVAGIPGLLCFVVFLGSVLRAAFGNAARDPALLGLGAGLATVVLSAVVAIYFSVPDMTTALGLVAGAIVAMASDSGSAAARRP
jgi:O-antigen ligase